MKRISQLIALILLAFLMGCNEKTDKEISKTSPIASDLTATQGGKYDSPKNKSVDEELLSKGCVKKEWSYECSEQTMLESGNRTS